MWYREALMQQPLFDLKTGFEPNADNTNNALDPPIGTPMELAVNNLKFKKKPGQIPISNRNLEEQLALARSGGEDPLNPGTPLGEDEPDFNPQVAATEMNQSNTPEQMYNAGRGVSKSFSQQGYFPPDNWAGNEKYKW